MAGLRPPLPLRRLHGPAEPGQGGGAAGPDRVIVTPPLTDTVGTTSTTQRDVTASRALAGLWRRSTARSERISIVLHLQGGFGHRSVADVTGSTRSPRDCSG